MLAVLAGGVEGRDDQSGAQANPRSIQEVVVCKVLLTRRACEK